VDGPTASFSNDNNLEFLTSTQAIAQLSADTAEKKEGKNKGKSITDAFNEALANEQVLSFVSLSPFPLLSLNNC
jgi:hypothetical protein